MTTPLVQYWTDEVARLSARQTAQAAEVAADRQSLITAQAAQLSASDAVRDRGLALAAARRALAGIPLPADGDPLLIAMQQALVDLADAQAALAAAGFTVALAAGELQRGQRLQIGFDTERAGAQGALTEAARAAADRAARIDQLTTGALANLAADAAAVLAASAATARTLVEGEFPNNAAAAKDFLTRVRARRQIVWDSLAASASVEAAAAATSPALALAQRAFDAADAALRSAAEAAPGLAADAATLARLAALPAATPPNAFPILTPSQHARLHDPSQQAARESALVKLGDVDAAQTAARSAQKAYDQALHAAMAAEPDKTWAALDASTLAPQLTTLNGKLADLTNARAAMGAGESATLQSWFACVPDGLWRALDELDAALARLETLVGPPTPANLIATLAGTEATLATALAADRLAQRKQAGATAAQQRAEAGRAAEQASASARASAYAHSGVLF